MPNTESHTVLVVVDDSSYLVYSLNETPSAQDLVTIEVLYELGGIAERTPPGKYHFTVEVLDDDHVTASLEPAE